MKVRIGFVSNSSSSSFVLGKNKLTDEQWSDLSEEIRELDAVSESDTNLFISKKYIHGTLDYVDYDDLIGILEEHNIPRDEYEIDS